MNAVEVFDFNLLSFPIIQETVVDGWGYSAITEFIDDNGCSDGDGCLVSPTGRYIGLDWEVGVGDIYKLSYEKNFWDFLKPKKVPFYHVFFDKPIYSTTDMATNFKAILPILKEIYFSEYPRDRKKIQKMVEK